MTDKDRAERDAIIFDINAAFAGVTRGEHGISWNECVALDRYESKDACKIARQSELDSHWNELVANPDWKPFPGIGGFCFINGEGFRYYLPPTMVRFLNGDQSEWYPGHLLGVIKQFTEKEMFSLWSDAQLRCIARFISFMARHDPSHDPEVFDIRWDNPWNPWKEAMEKCWHAYLRD